ncbi:MAG: ribonuclease HII [Rhodothermaeota bacterium MED-G19]|nr:MAG: ribonuclease HII [Rhodothermaeota bacterium MED-G19]
MLKKQFQKNLIEAGCDEVGRGCIAGPVVAAAVILPTEYFNNSIIDSKKLSPKKREKLGKEIIGNAIAWSVSEVSNNTIDKINILNGSILAMHRALDKLKVRPEFIIVDGNKFKPYKNVKHECIIKGDNKFQNIAAASIIAKNYRDDLMKNLSQKFDKYSWESNFGYPTKKHRNSIKKHGVTEYHRKSFKLL